MADREYNEDEVREIFQLATREDAPGAVTPAGSAGLTLAQLQSIGGEVGLGPDQIARAVAVFDSRAARPRRTLLGSPIEVGQIVPLPRAPTDFEWEQLVTELRATFNAKGRISVHGGLREWSNGGLHACIEPVESGYRLRLGTFKSDAMGVTAMGATGIVTSVIVFGSLAMSGNFGEAVFVSGIFGAAGLGALIANSVRLRGWARRREEQMMHIAARFRSIMGLDPIDESE
jgi:hypothetical protein